MPTVHIPSLLRDLSAGAVSVTAEGTTLREILEDLEKRFPGLKARLCEQDRIRRDLSVWIDGEISRAGMGVQVSENAEVYFLPAISGG